MTIVEPGIGAVHLRVGSGTFLHIHHKYVAHWPSHPRLIEFLRETHVIDVGWTVNSRRFIVLQFVLVKALNDDSRYFRTHSILPPKGNARDNCRETGTLEPGFPQLR